MATRENPYIENLERALNALSAAMPQDLARLLALYIRAFNDKSVVSTVSLAYIQNYDGKTIYNRYKRFFDQLHEFFLRNGFTDSDRHLVFKSVSRRCVKTPRNVKEMERLNSIVIEESQKLKRFKQTHELRKNLLSKFKLAIKKYLHLTYSLGYNEPSACARALAEQHMIDKYIMTGEFPILILPFLPEIEDAIRRNYEIPGLEDAWEGLKGRYFNHKREYSVLAIEIKSIFTRNISNFSEYFDNMFTELYYNMMIGKRKVGD